MFISSACSIEETYDPILADSCVTASIFSSLLFLVQKPPTNISDSLYSGLSKLIAASATLLEGGPLNASTKPAAKAR